MCIKFTPEWEGNKIKTSDILFSCLLFAACPNTSCVLPDAVNMKFIHFWSTSYIVNGGRRREIIVTFNTFWSTQLKNCAIKALHKIKISAESERREWNENWMAKMCLGMLLCLCVQRIEKATSSSGEGVEECGIKAIHVILTFLDFVYKNKLDRNRQVIEQKLWKTEKVWQGKIQKKFGIANETGQGSEKSEVNSRKTNFPLGYLWRFGKAVSNQNYKAPENYSQRLRIIHFHLTTLNMAGLKPEIS